VFLKNRVYVGEVHHGGKWFEGEHEAPNRDIDVLRVKLNRSRASTRLFRGDQNRSAAAKGIENETPPLRAILNRVNDHRNGLHRRVHGQFIHSSGSHGIYTVIVPHVRAMPPILAQFEGVEVRSRAILPDKDHLVL
jgi:hypothetical protein